MKSRKVDRRIEKSRQALQFALINLIIERGYDNITVQHVLDRADVSRSTFYAHFTGKEDLLVGSLDNLRIGLMKGWKAELAAGRLKGEMAFIMGLLRHMDGHRHIWKGIVGGESGRIMERQFRSMLTDMIRKDLGLGKSAKAVGDAAVTMAVGSLMSLLDAWMLGTVSGSPAEINDLYLRLTLPGIRSVLQPGTP